MIPELLTNPLPRRISPPAVLTTPYTSEDGQIWQVSAKICSAATCSCPNIFLELTSPDRDPISFAVDLENELVFDASEIEMEAFISSWTQDDWNEVDRWHHNENSFKISKIDTATIPLITFDKSDLADLSNYRNGRRVGFEDFFYADVGTPFECQNRRFRIQDSYCLRPGCSCSSAMLFLSEEIIQEPLQSSGLVHAPLGYKTLANCVFDVDTRHCSDFELEDGSKDEFDSYVACLKAFADACRPESPRERRALLANLIERHSRLMPSDEPTAPTIRRTTTKVGRNDPCPCGSGKKHKKCCG